MRSQRFIYIRNILITLAYARLITACAAGGGGEVEVRGEGQTAGRCAAVAPLSSERGSVEAMDCPTDPAIHVR